MNYNLHYLTNFYRALLNASFYIILFALTISFSNSSYAADFSNFEEPISWNAAAASSSYEMLSGSGSTITTAGLANVLCNDNGTPTDPSDDYITFDLQPAGVNLGPGYTILTGSGSSVVSPTTGTYTSTTSFYTVQGTAGAGDVVLTIVDQTHLDCTIMVTVSDPGTCGTTCNLSDPGLTNIQCNDNGTVNDPTDDYITFDLQPVGTNLGSGYTLLTGSGTSVYSPTMGVYSSSTTFSSLQGTAGAGDLSIIIVDKTDPNCTITTTVPDPGTCGITCNISDAGLTNVQCNDNGTAFDPSDDFITFDLNPIGTSIGTTYTIGAPVTSPTGTYGGLTSFTTLPGFAGTGDLLVTIIDDLDQNCMLDVIVSDPGSCELVCAIADPGITNVQCNDNGTPNDPFDDFIIFDMNPVGQNLGTTYSLPGVAPSSGVYGTTTTFFTPPGFAGFGDFPILMFDDVNPICFLDFFVPDPLQCSFDFNADPNDVVDPNDPMFMAFDPCSCNGDQVITNMGTVITPGTFIETVMVNGPPNLNLRIANVPTNTGFLDNNSNPIPLPIPMVEVSAGVYEITFNHTDAIGYDIQQFEFSTMAMPNDYFVVPGADFTPITITNACDYPKIACSPGLAATMDVTDTPINLGVSVIGTAAFTALPGYPKYAVNGTELASSTFDPSAFPVVSGNNTITTIYDIVTGTGNGGSIGNLAIPLDIDGDPSNGVCPIQIQKSVNITGNPAPAPVTPLVPIPTMSEWGLLIFALLMLNLGLVFLKRKEQILAGL